MIRTKKIAVSALLIAFGLILPQVFHLFGQDAGKMLLPMHLPVMVAGLYLGPVFGLEVGVITPFLGLLLTGMPPMPMAVFMMLELAAYGLVSGLLSKKMNLYCSLLIAMVAGRAVYAGACVLANAALGTHMPAIIPILQSYVEGLPGMIVQVVCVPLIVMALRKMLPFDAAQREA